MTERQTHDLYKRGVLLMRRAVVYVEIKIKMQKKALIELCRLGFVRGEGSCGVWIGFR